MSALSIDEALAECLSVMETMRDYVVRTESYAAKYFPDPMQRLAAIRESSRLTGRLTSVLSWLLWHKAALNGEIDQAELRAKTAEVVEDAPKAGPADNLDTLPEELRDLVTRSETLFERLDQLEGMSGTPF